MENDDDCLEMTQSARVGMSDSAAQERIRQILGNDPSILSEDRGLLKERLMILAGEGISICQLSRLSGIPKGIIERTVKQ